MKKQQPSSASGHVLAVVVSIIAIVTLMALSLLSMGLNSRTMAIRTTEKIKARCAADAGLTKALFEMNEKLKVKPWDDSTLPYAVDESLPNFDAVFSYKTASIASYKFSGGTSFKIAGSGSNNYIIESIGKAGPAVKRVYVNIGLQGLFEHAILTKESTVLKSDTLVDGYNSKDPTETDVELKIGTLSTSLDQIILNSGVKVDGDVVVGVDGDVNTVVKDLGAATGSRYSMTEEPSMPDVSTPVLPEMGMDITVAGGTLSIGPADSGKYTGIDVMKKGILEISGGEVALHITGDIELDQDCELIVKKGTSVKIYMEGNVVCRNNSSISNEGFPDPELLQLFAVGAGEVTFDLKAKSDWCGVVYAPHAQIVLNAKGNCYGAVIGKAFEYKSGGNFYYDVALRDVEADDDNVRFVVKRWLER